MTDSTNPPGIPNPLDSLDPAPRRPAPGSEGFLDAATAQGLFDRAVEHWNAGRFFEAHEDWETLWNDADGLKREWLQGLIQFAAGFVHVQRGGAAGFARLMDTAAQKAGGYPGDCYGIDWPRLWKDLKPWIAHGARVAAGQPLAKDAPPAAPTIRYLPGQVPAPLPADDADADEGGARGGA